MSERVSPRPGWARIASGAVAAGIANFVWVAAFVVSCGEPPYPETFCDDRGSLADPWYAAVPLAPCAVLVAGVVARRRGAPVLFEVTWIALVCFALLAFFAPAVVD
jgi:hypothetical protein